MGFELRNGNTFFINLFIVCVFFFGKQKYCVKNLSKKRVTTKKISNRHFELFSVRNFFCCVKNTWKKSRKDFDLWKETLGFFFLIKYDSNKK